MLGTRGRLAGCSPLRHIGPRSRTTSRRKACASYARPSGSRWTETSITRGCSWSGRAAITDELGLKSAAEFRDEELGLLEMYSGDPVAAERAYRRNCELFMAAGDEGHGSTTARNSHGHCVGWSASTRLRTLPASPATPRRMTTWCRRWWCRSAQSSFSRLAATRWRRENGTRCRRDGADAQAPNTKGDLWLVLADVLRRAGKPSDAEDAARTALALFDGKGNRPAAARARSLLAELSL